MHDLRDYLRAYWAYFSRSGWRGPLIGLIWLAGMFAPLGAKTFVVDLPNSVAIPWMIVWAVIGYVFAPYGMWKALRKK